jgi:hypothetical protein
MCALEDRFMVVFIGLTDDPARSRAEHSNPADWQQITFRTETEAEAWKTSYVGDPGFEVSLGTAGWRFGFWYSVTSRTKE